MACHRELGAASSVITIFIISGVFLVFGGGYEVPSFSLNFRGVNWRSSPGSGSVKGENFDALGNLRRQCWMSALSRGKLLETAGYFDQAELQSKRCYREYSMGEFRIEANGLSGRNVSTFLPLSFMIHEACYPGSIRHRLGGKYFRVSVEGSPWADPATRVRMPQALVEDHSNGSYSVVFEVYDEDVLYNATVHLWYAGYGGYLGSLRDLPRSERCPALPQLVFLGNISFSTTMVKSDQNNTTRELSDTKGLRTATPVSSQNCPLAARGRWLNNSWELADCPSCTHFTQEKLMACARDKGPFHLTLVGDSIMRGIFFDMREILLNKRPERSNLHHDQQAVEDLPGFTLEFKWTPYSHQLFERLQGGDFYGNTSSTLIFNTLQWDLRNPGRIDDYLGSTKRFLEALGEVHDRFQQVIWRSGSAIHSFGPEYCEANCSADAFINAPRGELYNSAVHLLVEATTWVDILDMWQISSGRPDLQHAFHWDTSYISHAIVSKTVGNVLFNVFCGSVS